MAGTDSWRLVSARGGVSAPIAIFRPLANFNFDSVLQFVETVHRDHLTWLDPLDGGDSAVGRAHRDVLYSGGVVRFDDIHKRLLRIPLNCRRGNQNHSLLCLNQKPRIDELIGKKDVILVVENR